MRQQKNSETFMW